MEKLYYTLLPFASPAWPLLVRVNLLVSFLFLFIAFLLFLFILVSRLRDGIRFSKKRTLEQESQLFITSYLFDEEEWDNARTTTFRKKYCRTHFQRQVVLSNLILLHKNIIGESSTRLRVLYQELELHSYSKQKLYTSSWELIATGIGELSEMRMKQDAKLIEAFINHPHPILRSEAQVALIKLQKEAPFSFLDKLEEPLREWQQMLLTRAAQKANYTKMPDFARWLGKNEATIVVFCIRMISQYNQHDAVPALIQLLAHTSASVRRETIIALRHLEAFGATASLMQLFWQEPLQNKSEILKTLRAIADEEAYPLYDALLQSQDKVLQLAAAKAIAQSGASGEERMKIIYSDLQNKLHPLAAYALDARL